MDHLNLEINLNSKKKNFNVSCIHKSKSSGSIQKYYANTVNHKSYPFVL